MKSVKKKNKEKKNWNDPEPRNSVLLRYADKAVEKSLCDKNKVRVSEADCVRCHGEYNDARDLSTTILARREKKSKEHLLSPCHTAVSAPLLSFCNFFWCFFFLFVFLLLFVFSLEYEFPQHYFFPYFLQFCYFFMLLDFAYKMLLLQHLSILSFILGKKNLWIQCSDYMCKKYKNII